MGDSRGPRRSPTDDGRRADARSIRTHLRELMWPRRGRLLLGITLMLIGRLAGLVLPGATKYLIDEVIGGRDLELLTRIVTIAGVAVLVQALTGYALVELLSKPAQALIAELRVKVQRHVGRLPVRYYDDNKVGALVSRIMTDVEGVRNLVGTGLVELVGGIFTAAVAFFILLHINVMMTLVTLGSLAIFTLILQRAFAYMRPRFRKRGEINAEVTGRLAESLGGVRVVKGFRAEEREAAVFAAGAERLFENIKGTLTATALTGLSSRVLMGIVGVLVMLIGGRLVLAGEMTVGEFFAYTLYLGFLITPTFQIVNIGSQITEAFAGLDRMDEVLSELPEDDAERRIHAMPEVHGHIRFEDVEFEYEAGKPVIRGVTIDAGPGTVTALVGSSGSGKSTLTGLVAGFMTPTAGQVVIDGVDLADVRLGDYREHLGVVLQESFLFAGTIRENIAFSRPQASEAEIEQAAHLAHVDEFSDRFEHGLDTVVGERGVKLSGGQRQRVSIARAVLADPRILILDEATSSLDSESEAYIQNGLRTLMKGRTTFVIAHRLSTIRTADQILVLEGGRIVEAGKHDDLLASLGRYHELYTNQAGLEANRFINPGEGETEATEEEKSKTESSPSAIQILRDRT